MEREFITKYASDGKKYFEGYMTGAATKYYRDGSVFREGYFSHGLITFGIEYYPNGQKRFEGIFKKTGGYGPTSPFYGNYYDMEGNLKYSGQFKHAAVGNLAWPIVTYPEDYGRIEQFTPIRETQSPPVWTEDLIRDGIVRA